MDTHEEMCLIWSSFRGGVQVESESWYTHVVAVCASTPKLQLVGSAHKIDALGKTYHCTVHLHIPQFRPLPGHTPSSSHLHTLKRKNSKNNTKTSIPHSTSSSRRNSSASPHTASAPAQPGQNCFTVTFGNVSSTTGDVQSTNPSNSSSSFQNRRRWSSRSARPSTGSPISCVCAVK